MTGALSLPAQDGKAFPTIAEIRQRVAEASRAGYEQLEALTGYLDAAGSTANPECIAVHECAATAFLAWCTDATHATAAARRAATFATSYAGLVLGEDSGPQRALAMLERVWPHRDLAGYRACELTLAKAEVHLVRLEYAAAREALQCYASLRTGPAWKAWEALRPDGLMLPIHNVQYERDCASIEGALGNPERMRNHLRRAEQILSHQRPKELPAGLAPTTKEALRLAWANCALGVRLQCIEGHLQFGEFAQAAQLAQESGAWAREFGVGATFDLYGVMARSWDHGASAAEHDAARAALERFAEDDNPELARRALRRLLEWAAERNEHERADGFLATLIARGGQSFLDTTLQSELLLSRPEPDTDAGRAAWRAELHAQRAAQRGACERMYAEWRELPPSASGNGFLYYLDRRETIAQFVRLAQRCAEVDGTALPIAEVFECVLGAQTHGNLATRLGATVPTLAAVQVLLAPRQGILVFLPGRTRTHVFTIDRGSARHHALAHGALAIRDDVQQMVELLSVATGQLEHEASSAQRLAAELDTVGARLVDRLFPAEVRARLVDWDRLTVIGAELLYGPAAGRAEAGFGNCLLVECLPWDATAKFGERFAIDNNASLPAWACLAHKARAIDVQSTLRIFGTLREAGAPGDARRDRLADGDVARLGADFKRRDAHPDDQFTLVNLRRRPPAAASIALFFSHGGYDASRQPGSFLQMHDQQLHCADVERLGDPTSPFADVVLLGVCRAAMGLTSAGEGNANLGASFLLAGATTVVQSRFDVPLHGTQTLVDRVLAQMARGRSCATALRAARREVAEAADDPLAVYRASVLQVYGFGQDQPSR